MSAREWNNAKRLTAVAVLGFLTIATALTSVGYLTVSRARDDARALAASLLQDRVALAANELAATPSAEPQQLLDTARSYRPTPRSIILLFDAQGRHASPDADTNSDLSSVARRIEQAGIAASDGSSDLKVEGERWNSATRTINANDPDSLRVALAVPSADLRSANVLARGFSAVIAITALLIVWTVGCLVTLGIHGAWPSPNQRHAHDDSKAKSFNDTGEPVDWVVTCIRVRSADGGGITLDNAPDEHSHLLESVEHAATEHGLRIAGRMPDRVLAVELQDDDPEHTGDRSLRFALAVLEAARGEVRRRQMLVTIGVGGGGFGDDADDDESWGGRSLRLAEHLAATGRPETILVGDRIVRSIGQGFVFDDPGKYWIESCGQADVWHLRGAR